MAAYYGGEAECASAVTGCGYRGIHLPSNKGI